MSSFFARPQAPSEGFVVAGCQYGVSEPVFIKSGLIVNKKLHISRCVPVLDKFLKKTTKMKKSCFGRNLASTLRKGHVGPIRRANN
jgi:hypothetical protein